MNRKDFFESYCGIPLINTTYLVFARSHQHFIRFCRDVVDCGEGIPQRSLKYISCEEVIQGFQDVVFVFYGNWDENKEYRKPIYRAIITSKTGQAMPKQHKVSLPLITETERTVLWKSTITNRKCIMPTALEKLSDENDK